MTRRRRRSDRSGRAPLFSPGRPVVGGRNEQRQLWAGIAAGMASQAAPARQSPRMLPWLRCARYYCDLCNSCCRDTPRSPWPIGRNRHLLTLLQQGHGRAHACYTAPAGRAAKDVHPIAMQNGPYHRSVAMAHAGRDELARQINAMPSGVRPPGELPGEVLQTAMPQRPRLVW